MMGRRKAAIGVDIGGTKISAGIVGGEGLVYASPRTIATNPKEPGEVIIANLFSLLKIFWLMLRITIFRALVSGVPDLSI